VKRGAPRLVSAAVVQQAALLVRAGMTVVDAARVVGVLQVTLRARFKADCPEILTISRENWERRRAQRVVDRQTRRDEQRAATACRWKRRRVTRDQIEAVARRIADGETQAAVAADYGVVASTLCRALKALRNSALRKECRP
jgi:hypothetical protein